jgi:uncharacterized membrane protein YfbV (UPF0208 family)
MSYKDTLLDPRLQKLVDLGESGTDIMHGELKNLMYECETKLLDTSQFVGQLQENPEYKYLSGRMDALTEIYIMTYNLAFALNERIVSRG